MALDHAIRNDQMISGDNPSCVSTGANIVYPLLAWSLPAAPMPTTSIYRTINTVMSGLPESECFLVDSF